MEPTIRIAVVDDDSQELKMIYRMVKEGFQKLNVPVAIQSFQHSVKFLMAQQQAAYDAVFLDIDMPDMNGMETAERLDQLNTGTEIIFVTNYDELVYKTYRFKALGFLRKKHLETELMELLEVLLSALQRHTKYMIFQDAGKLFSIRMEDVLFLQSDDHYIEVFTKYGKELIRGSLNTVEETYQGMGLIRTHVRYLVNCQYLYSIEKNTVVLQNGQHLPLSRSKRTTVQQQFQTYMRWRT